jgi:D-alanine-D-alanine ligase
VASAQNLSDTLGECRLWFIAPSGAVHECAAGALRSHKQPFVRDFEPVPAHSWPSLVHALDAVNDGDSSRRDRSSVFFLALHGGAGEDGTVQRLLEERALGFTGSGSAASARAFDKQVAKEIVSAHGISVVPGAGLPKADATAITGVLREFLAKHGQIIVKPVADGSSVGMHVLRGSSEIASVAAAVAGSGRAYLAEVFTGGVEVTVGVVDDGSGPRALPLTEIRVERGRVFDYEGKYLGQGTREITPAEISPEMTRKAGAAGVRAHTALGCEGYSRTDFIVAGEEVIFIELNTLPGLTRESLVPQQLVADGRSIRDFVARQVALATRRRDLRARS